MKFLACSVLFVLFFGGCGSSYQKSENLRFGVDVAKRGLWKEAAGRWEKVLKLDPSNAMAYNNLAVAYEQAGEYEKAEEAYQKALKLDGENKWINDNYLNFKEFYAWYMEQEKEEDSEEAQDESPEDQN
jgi:Tfp pilus assembly protein PilF